MLHFDSHKFDSWQIHSSQFLIGAAFQSEMLQVIVIACAFLATDVMIMSEEFSAELELDVSFLSVCGVRLIVAGL